MLCLIALSGASLPKIELPLWGQEVGSTLSSLEIKNKILLNLKMIYTNCTKFTMKTNYV